MSNLYAKPTDFLKTLERMYTDSRILYEKEEYYNCCYLCGYVLECALKFILYRCGRRLDGEVYTVDDMKKFAHNTHGMTSHVETVVCLSQQKPDDVIRVGLDLDELEVTPAESKATYGEIKAYVREKFGLKVSSLYISQVKRKCGLEVGENYNLPKSENAKQPQCPPEKENAIIEALRHFQMIEEAQ